MEEAQPYGDAAALAAGKAVGEPGVGQVGEAELVEEGGYYGSDVGGFRFEETRGEGEGLGHGEEREACVVLGDVGGELAEGGGVEGVGVEEEGAAGGGGSGGQDVEEGGFSGATGAHDGEDFGGVCGEGDVF